MYSGAGWEELWLGKLWVHTGKIRRKIIKSSPLCVWTGNYCTDFGCTWHCTENRSEKFHCCPFLAIRPGTKGVSCGMDFAPVSSSALAPYWSISKPNRKPGKSFFLAKGQDEGQPNRREVTKGKLPLCKVAKVLLSAHLHHLDWAPISWPLFMAFSLKGTGRARKNFHKVLTEMRWSCCQCTNGTASHSGVLHILARNHNRIGLNPASSNSWVPCHLPNSQIEDFTFCTSVFLKTKASFNFKTTSKAALTRKLYLTDWGKNMQNQVW